MRLQGTMSIHPCLSLRYHDRIVADGVSDCFGITGTCFRFKIQRSTMPAYMKGIGLEMETENGPLDMIGNNPKQSSLLTVHFQNSKSHTCPAAVTPHGPGSVGAPSNSADLPLLHEDRSNISPQAHGYSQCVTFHDTLGLSVLWGARLDCQDGVPTTKLQCLLDTSCSCI